MTLRRTAADRGGPLWVTFCRLRRGSGALTPKAVDGPGQLHQLRPAESSDVLRGIDLKPCHRPLDGVGADSQSLARRRQRCRNRLVRIEVLTRGQRFEKVLKVGLDESAKEESVHRSPNQLATPATFETSIGAKPPPKANRATTPPTPLSWVCFAPGGASRARTIPHIPAHCRTFPRAGDGFVWVCFAWPEGMRDPTRRAPAGLFSHFAGTAERVATSYCVPHAISDDERRWAHPFARMGGARRWVRFVESPRERTFPHAAAHSRTCRHLPGAPRCKRPEFGRIIQDATLASLPPAGALRDRKQKGAARDE
jgi:hypothetical protein